MTAFSDNEIDNIKSCEEAISAGVPPNPRGSRDAQRFS